MNGVFEPMSFDGRRDGAHESFTSYQSFSSFASLGKDTLAGHGNGGKLVKDDTFTSPTSQSTSSFVDTAYADDPFIVTSDPFEIATSAFELDLDLADFGLESTIGGYGSDYGFDFGSDIGSDVYSSPLSTHSTQAGPSKLCSSSRAPLDYTLASYTLGSAVTATLGPLDSTSTGSPRPTTSVSEYDNSPLVTPASRDRTSFSSTSPEYQRAGFSWDDAPHILGASTSFRRTTDPLVSHTAAPTYAAHPAPLRVVSTPSLTASTTRKTVKPVMSMPSLKEEDLCFEWLNIPDGPEQVQHPASNQEFDWVFGSMGMDPASLDGTIFAAFKEGETANDSWSDLANMAMPTPKMATAPPTVPPSASSSSSAVMPKPAQVPALPASNSTDTQLFMSESTSAPSSMSFLPDTPAVSGEIADPFAFTSSVADIRPATAPEESFETYGMLSAPGPMVRSHTAPGMPQRAAPSDIFYQPPTTVPASTSFDIDVPSYASIPPPLSTSSSASATTSGFVVPQQHRSFSGRRPHPQLSVNVESPSFGVAGSYPHTPQSAIYPSHATASASLVAPVTMTRAGSQPLPTRRASSSAIGSSSESSNPRHPPLPAHMVRAAAMVQAAEAREEAARQEYRRQAAARRVPMEQASVMQPPTPTRPSVLGWNGNSQLQQTQYVQPIPQYHHQPPPALQQQPMLYQPLQQQQQVHIQQQHQYVQQPTVNLNMVAHPPAPMPQQQQAQPPHYQPTYAQAVPQQSQVHALPQPPTHVQHPPAAQASTTTAPAGPSSYGYQSQPPKALAPPHIAGEYDPHARSRSHPVPISHPPSGSTHITPILTNQPLVVHPPVSGGFTYTAPPPHRIHPPPQSAGLPMTATAGPFGADNNNGQISAARNNRPMARLPSPRSRKVSSPPKNRSPSGRKRTQTAPGGFSWGEATFINFTSDDAEKLLTGVAPSGSQNKRKREEEQARLAMQLGPGQMQVPMPMRMPGQPQQDQMHGQMGMMNLAEEGQAGKRIRTE